MLLDVDLVNDEDDWFPRFAQRACEFFVDWRQSVLCINNEQKKIAFAQRLLGGAANLIGEVFFARAENSAGVPKHKRFLSASADRRDSIACDSGLIVNDGDFSTDEPIK